MYVAYIYTYICIIYVYMYTHMYICIYIIVEYTYTHMYIYTYVCVSAELFPSFSQRSLQTLDTWHESQRLGPLRCQHQHFSAPWALQFRLHGCDRVSADRWVDLCRMGHGFSVVHSGTDLFVVITTYKVYFLGLCKGLCPENMFCYVRYCWFSCVTRSFFVVDSSVRPKHWNNPRFTRETLA